MDKINLIAELFNKHAALYQEKYMDVSLYHDTFDLFCDSIARGNAAILEIGCGPGNITQYLLKKRPDFNILGIDLSLNMVHLAQANNPRAEFQVMDCRNIGRLNKKYDAVMCGFCLPYLSKEESVQLISDAAGLLQPEGILYISTMEDDYSKSGIQYSSTGDALYMYFHQADYLTAALEDNGFQLIGVQRKEYPGPGGGTTVDLIIVAGKSG